MRGVILEGLQFSDILAVVIKKATRILESDAPKDYVACDGKILKQKGMGDVQSFKKFIQGTPFHVISAHGESLLTNLKKHVHPNITLTTIPFGVGVEEFQKIISEIEIEEPLVIWGCGGAGKNLGTHLRDRLGKTCIDMGAVLDAWAGLPLRRYFRPSGRYHHCLIKSDVPQKKDKKMNILVFPGGSEIGLGINRALHNMKDIQLFSANAPGSNHAPYVFKKNFEVPLISKPDWFRYLNQVVEENEIDYIFPANDDVLVACVDNQHRLKAKVIAPDLSVCQLTRSKKETYEFLKGVFPVPKVYTKDEEIPFPVFLKPDKGAGSHGTSVAHNQEELLAALTPDHLILEYLTGPEYTIDCFSDRVQGLMYCRGRERIRTANGISMDCKSIDNPQFQILAQIIQKHLKIYGSWFFQLKESKEGELKLLEIAPRIAGTMCLHQMTGVNFPLLSIYEQERMHIEILTNGMEVTLDRTLKDRYRHNLRYNKVYVDLDDTLILRGEVNLDLVRFLYQCVNKGIKLILISRHEGSIEEPLKKYRLERLFDEVLHLGKKVPKSDFIEGKDSIFIDDSFRERSEVAKSKGIPTFDCSMIEMLFEDQA